MKYVRFEYDGEVLYGVLENETINILKGDIFDQHTLIGKKIRLNEVKLLAPCQPSKAVCVGLNYLDHAQEMNSELPRQPLLFLKPSSALNHPEGEIVYPALTKNLHYEAELAIVIKRTAKKVAAENAAEYILGFTCANDVTARDLQKGDGQWTRGKSFDTFLPLGPCIATEIDSDNLKIELLLNDKIKQSSNTGNLIFKIPQLIAFITQVMTLYPGDVILTGTPSGVGPMQVGDIVTVRIEGIGKLSNKVISDF